MSDSLLTRVIAKYRNQGLRGVYRAIRMKYVLATQQHPIERALKVLDKSKSVTLVQIGAYVGGDSLTDFIRKRSGNGLKAVLVEPVRESFERLSETYHGLEGVHLENVAIANQAGELDFYRIGVDPSAFGMPGWLKELASLKEERMKYLWDNYENDQRLKQFYLEHRVVEKVRCITFNDLIAKHAINRLDLLQIDAEGYDYEILKTVPFDSVQPRYLNYESTLLGDSEYECRSMVIRSGYSVFDYLHDTFCTRRRS